MSKKHYLSFEKEILSKSKESIKEKKGRIGKRIRRLSNRIKFKPNASLRDETGKIIPVMEFCFCGRKVRHHHVFCDRCWKKNKKRKIFKEKEFN